MFILVNLSSQNLAGSAIEFGAVPPHALPLMARHPAFVPASWHSRLASRHRDGSVQVSIYAFPGRMNDLGVANAQDFDSLAVIVRGFQVGQTEERTLVFGSDANGGAGFSRRFSRSRSRNATVSLGETPPPGAVTVRASRK